MLRIIGAAVLGYIAIAIVVFCGLTLAYLVLGADRAFRQGVYDIATVWAVASVAVSLGAAVLGGWVARRVARNATGPRVLAVVVAILGIALAVPAMLAAPESASVRPGAVGMFEAMQHAQTPLWIMLLNPLIGAFGVLVGGGGLGSARAATVHNVATS